MVILLFFILDFEQENSDFQWMDARKDGSLFNQFLMS